MAKFQLNILGCGSATPTMRHNPTCQIIDFRDKLMMIDCGEGSQLQMRRQHLKFSRLSHVFISHLHGDHFLGLPGLLSTLALHDTSASLTVHTFEEGADILQKILGVFCRDIPFPVHYNVIKPEKAVVYEDHALTVESVPLYHRVPCVGYIFREKPKPRHLIGDMVRFHQVPVSALPSLREGADFTKPDGTVVPNRVLTTDPDPSVSYAYCSDTAFDPRVAEAVRGVDTLFHEATYQDDCELKAAQRGHTTARQAARIAAMAGVKRLVLGHYSKRYESDEGFLREALEEFPNVVLANEGLKLDLL